MPTLPQAASATGHGVSAPGLALVGVNCCPLSMTLSPTTFSLPVLAAEPASRSQVLLRLATGGSAFSDLHRAPGQYATFGFPGVEKKKPLVLASAPHEADTLLLVKAASDEEFARLLRLPGESLQVDAPAGRGFPLEEARGRPLWMLAVGSGVGAIRPVVESVLLDPAGFREVHVRYGVRHPDDLAFVADAARWCEGLTSFLQVVSRPEGSSWRGPTGYVQDHLPPADALRGAVVFLCGLPRMDADCVAALGERGVAADQIFRNYG